MFNVFTAVSTESGTILEALEQLWKSMGLSGITTGDFWLKIIMLAVAGLLLYLAIVKQFEPNLLLAMAFGMFIINIPGAYEILFPQQGVLHEITAVTGQIQSLQALIATANAAEGFVPFMFNEVNITSLAQANEVLAGLTNQFVLLQSQKAAIAPGLFDFLYYGVDWVIFPPIIFLGIGAMTDFGPLIANPKSLLLGAAAQLGIFITFFGALFMGFSGEQAASIAIIGGADGPTAIYVTSKLAKDLLPAIAIAAYSYMALVPVIQPPIMKALTTKKERMIVMGQLRQVSKTEKVIFPVLVTGIVGIILPSAIPLLGMLMLGNLMKESEVVPRLTSTAKNELINIITIFLGLIVGAKAYAPVFLKPQVLLILILGIIAFSFGTGGGVLLGKLMCKLTKGKINPLIGAAGVSAVPMAARVAQDVGRKENPNNYLLMHAMGPNVAGVIGSAVAAGVLLAMFGTM